MLNKGRHCLHHSRRGRKWEYDAPVGRLKILIFSIGKTAVSPYFGFWEIVVSLYFGGREIAVSLYFRWKVIVR